jgi:integrase
MPAQKRHKTKYAGVYYIEAQAAGARKAERIYYITYRRDGRQIHEKAGRQFRDDMTPARAAGLRAQKMEGALPSNKERRLAEEAARKAAGDRWTIAKLWEAYKKSRPELKGLSTDQNRFDNHIEPDFGDQQPSELVPLDIDRVRLRLLKTRAPATVKNVLELLRRIINFGTKKRLCEGLDFTIEMPRVNNLKTEDLTAAQLAALLEAIDADTHEHAGDMMRLALYTGMRRGEMFRLRWQDVDFERGFIHLRDTKGGLDQQIPLNDAARELLLKRPRKRSAYVFPGRGGKRRRDINKAVNAIKLAAGLPAEFRPLHGLRHVYATILASSGRVDLYTLQKLLTHKSPRMTQRYAHLRDEALKKAGDVAAEMIDSALERAASDDAGSNPDVE